MHNITLVLWDYGRGRLWEKVCHEQNFQAIRIKLIRLFWTLKNLQNQPKIMTLEIKPTIPIKYCVKSYLKPNQSITKKLFRAEVLTPKKITIRKRRPHRAAPITTNLCEECRKVFLNKLDGCVKPPSHILQNFERL